MLIHLLFLSHNRLEYTKLALSSILEDITEEFSLTIWDNASTDGTVEYLKGLNDPRILDLILSKENVGQMAAVNQVWSSSKAVLLGKLDNDCLLPPGWTRKLAKAHQDIQNLGAVACWHYPLDDFDERTVRKAGKIQHFNGHQIFRHPWTCGTGFLIKRETFLKFGPIQCESVTQYWLRIALEGYINGWYYPLLLQEHMDDPRSKHCLVADDASIRKMRDITYVLREHSIKNMQDRWKRRRLVLRNLNRDPWKAKYYLGWRGKIRRLTKFIEKFFELLIK
jgi:GT2 family glycosyltransferase